MDQVVLSLDSTESHGYQAMSILHYLGITKKFKDLFNEVELEKAIDLLSENSGESYLEIIESSKRTLHKKNSGKIRI